MFAPLPVVGHVIVVGHVSPLVVLQLTWQPHEVPQLTLPHAGSRPVQVAVHLPAPQIALPHAALPPPHVSVHVPPVHVIAALQAFEPVQSRLQSPVDEHVSEPQTCWPPPPLHVSVQSPVEHVTLPHASEPVQVAVQSPLVQPMLPHAFVPVQSTVQSFVWHVMPRHALSALQWTLQPVPALPQLIVPHAPLVGHEMSQFHPVGHVMLPLPVPVIGQSRVIKLHDGQIEGHDAASSGRASIGRVPTTQ
jgi:hypothetical protein